MSTCPGDILTHAYLRTEVEKKNAQDSPAFLFSIFFSSRWDFTNSEDILGGGKKLQGWGQLPNILHIHCVIE